MKLLTGLPLPFKAEAQEKKKQIQTTQYEEFCCNGSGQAQEIHFSVVSLRWAPQYYLPLSFCDFRADKIFPSAAASSSNQDLKPVAQNPGFDALTNSTAWGVWYQQML